jgi:hypothetical protein
VHRLFPLDSKDGPLYPQLYLTYRRPGSRRRSRALHTQAPRMHTSTLEAPRLGFTWGQGLIPRRATLAGTLFIPGADAPREHRRAAAAWVVDRGAGWRRRRARRPLHARGKGVCLPPQSPGEGVHALAYAVSLSSLTTNWRRLRVCVPLADVPSRTCSPSLAAPSSGCGNPL